MLFDLQGKRKRLIQVIYVFLALLLGGGLVFFGIGGSAGGGLGDALGIGGSNTGSGSPEFNDQIDSGQSTLATDPEDTAALLNLARYSYLNGQQKLGVDDEGFPVLTEEAAADFEASVDAWERYLKVNKGKADTAAATLVFRAYSNIAFNSSNPVAVQRRLEGAQRTAAVIAEERPSPNSYFELAGAAYRAGDTAVAEQASAKALKLVDDAGRIQLEAQLKAAKNGGRTIRKQIKQLEADPSAIDDPLGGLGGADTGSGLTPGDGG